MHSIRKAESQNPVSIGKPLTAQELHGDETGFPESNASANGNDDEKQFAQCGEK
jgi:hypothetical protein